MSEIEQGSGLGCQKSSIKSGNYGNIKKGPENNIFQNQIFDIGQNLPTVP